jgi:hypothetical protein
MSRPAIDATMQADPAGADLADAAPVPASPPAVRPTSTASPRPALTRSFSSAGMPVGRPTPLSAVAHVQLLCNRALAETAYRLRRVGTPTLAGAAAAVLAAVVFINGNLPQGAAITALRSEVLRPTPLRTGAVKPGPAGAVLASLPPRTEAASVVSKILEEARAAGVELPRGQYEYVPPRDGMAARYRMTFPVHATYPQIRKFMDRTLVALPAVAIEGLRIERKNVGDDGVDAELKLSAYVRSDP